MQEGGRGVGGRCRKEVCVEGRWRREEGVGGRWRRKEDVLEVGEGGRKRCWR